MSVWLSVNLVTILLSILSYCRINILRGENQAVEQYMLATLALIFATVLGSQILWIALYLQFSTWAMLDLTAVITVVYLICYGFYLDTKRSRAVILYFCLASSLLSMTMLSECLRYFSSI